MDTGYNRKLSIHRDGFPDVVAWNPWAEKAKAFADFGDEEYHVSIQFAPAGIGSQCCLAVQRI